MPDEPKTTTPAPTAEDKVADSIVNGLRKALPEMTRAMAEQMPKSAPVTAPSAPVAAALSRPSEEEIAEATIDGNKARLAGLLRQQRAYDDQVRSLEIGNLSTQGGAAINSIARTAATTLPNYKRFKSEIDAAVDTYVQNTGGIASLDVYERAHEMVTGKHSSELIAEATEEAIRKAREPQPAIMPTNERGERIEPEPTSLSEVLKGDWKREFREKQGRTGTRSEDEELRKVGFRGGFKEFIETRKQMDAIDEETNGSFGLDRDWVVDDAKTGAGHWVN